MSILFIIVFLIFLFIFLCYFMGLVMIKIINNKLKDPLILTGNQLEHFSSNKKRKKANKRISKNKKNSIQLNLNIPIEKIIDKKIKNIFKKKNIKIKKDVSNNKNDKLLNKYKNYYRNLGKYEKDKSDVKVLKQLKLEGYNFK